MIPRYDIDLAVVKGPNGYPYCNVAMYMRSLYQPTEPGVTFIYAHARTGMFLPLLNASKKNDGAAMIGKMVYVYTSEVDALHVHDHEGPAARPEHRAPRSRSPTSGCGSRPPRVPTTPTRS